MASIFKVTWYSKVMLEFQPSCSYSKKQKRGGLLKELPWEITLIISLAKLAITWPTTVFEMGTLLVLTKFRAL